MGRPPTPWTDPKVGDVCVLASGTKRTVQQVSRTEWYGGTYPDRVVYEQDGNTRTCSAERWARKARAAMQGGGSYQRDGVTYRCVDGAFVARE